MAHEPLVTAGWMRCWRKSWQRCYVASWQESRNAGTACPKHQGAPGGQEQPCRRVRKSQPRPISRSLRRSSARQRRLKRRRRRRSGTGNAPRVTRSHPVRRRDGGPGQRLDVADLREVVAECCAYRHGLQDDYFAPSSAAVTAHVDHPGRSTTSRPCTTSPSSLCLVHRLPSASQGAFGRAARSDAHVLRHAISRRPLLRAAGPYTRGSGVVASVASGRECLRFMCDEPGIGTLPAQAHCLHRRGSGAPLVKRQMATRRSPRIRAR